MEFLSDYGLFLLKSITLVVAILVVFAAILALRHKSKSSSDLEIRHLNKEYESLQRTLHKKILNKKYLKNPKKNQPKHHLFVLDFQGDMKASQAEQLREQITAILSIATKEDEVLLRLESPGGAVSGYGLCASQLQRLKDKKIPLTVCIDKVAASGGYLMACVAEKIIAAPFAIIGSIGVIAQIPNFYRWLQKNDIDVELLTAGEYKRTLTLLGQNTDKGRQKFQEDLEKIHSAFRDYVLMNREEVPIEQVATGEHWLAKDALALHLIDSLATSDEYLMSKINSFNVYKLSIPTKPSLLDKLIKPAMHYLPPLKFEL